MKNATKDEAFIRALRSYHKSSICHRYRNLPLRNSLDRKLGKLSFAKMLNFDFDMIVEVGSIIATTVWWSTFNMVDGMVGTVSICVLKIRFAFTKINKFVEKIRDKFANLANGWCANDRRYA